MKFITTDVRRDNTLVLNVCYSLRNKKMVLVIMRVDTQRSAGIYAIIEKRKPYNHGIHLPKVRNPFLLLTFFMGRQTALTNDIL